MIGMVVHIRVTEQGLLSRKTVHENLIINGWKFLFSFLSLYVLDIRYRMSDIKINFFIILILTFICCFSVTSSKICEFYGMLISFLKIEYFVNTSAIP